MSARRAALCVLAALLLGLPRGAEAQQDWGWSLGVRAGAYAPSAAILNRLLEVGLAEGEIGYSPFVAVEAGLASGRPPFLFRLMVGHAPSMDIAVWRRVCGRGAICSMGIAPGGITTIVGEIAAPTGAIGDWDWALVGGMGVKRYGWAALEPPCQELPERPGECEDARALTAARSVFTVHAGVEASYEIGRYDLVVELADYLSGFGVRTEGSAQGQFQNDLIVAAGVRYRR